VLPNQAHQSLWDEADEDDEDRTEDHEVKAGDTPEECF
jgi:hypothetical protein